MRPFKVVTSACWKDGPGTSASGENSSVVVVAGWVAGWVWSVVSLGIRVVGLRLRSRC